MKWAFLMLLFFNVMPNNHKLLKHIALECFKTVRLLRQHCTFKL